MAHYGFTVDNVVATARAVLANNRALRRSSSVDRAVFDGEADSAHNPTP
jgi:hypothetical protein